MKFLKNPIFWVAVLVLALVVVGYRVMQMTALQQEAIRFKEQERLLVMHQYNLYSVAMVPPSTLWAVGSRGTLMHSKDRGETWEARKIEAVEQVFSSISFPDKDHGWIVGTRGMILHTEDAGKTWKRIKRKDDNYFSKVFFVDVEHGWIVGEMGTVLRTTDGGKTWDLIETDKFLTIFNDIKFVNKDKGWVVGEGGVIMASLDGGLTWKDQTSGTIKSFMSVFPFTEDKVWVGGLEGAIFLTEDAGKTWVKKTLMYGEDTTSNHVYRICEQKSGTEGYGYEQNQIYVLCRNIQQVSCDVGYSWRPVMIKEDAVRAALGRGWLHDIVFDPNDKEAGWIVGKWGIILKTIDAENWIRVN